MQENLEELWQQVRISEGIVACQTCCLSGKFQAKQEVLKDPSPSTSDLFRLANQVRCEHLNVQDEKPVYNDTGELCLDGRAKQAAWKEHYEHLSKAAFDWDPDSLKSDLSKAQPPHLTWADD